MSSAVRTALSTTDWADLARQKLALLELQGEIKQITETERKDGDPERAAALKRWRDSLEGLVHFIGAVQGAAETDGYPVRYLSVPEAGDPGHDPEQPGRTVLVDPAGHVTGTA